ncbi:FKBP-type peptidyl-prolyl cis-trans isomerase [Sphingobium subterraneum]|uniref:Peptidyl-prolyl cis-trans isomerase n=1 Tax=Sphingobium subterraneum TaxID=627688 RepID=A0A841IXC3_9SPHN|nr:FKBP-type peptidyl-prolyl cis-trans isomerase [Sphingobium subterraneum]MBB6123313.1 FKBP-type peptidyl-prolyl cis-trans isomerase FkpA [Sphingobium subterraneum]
MSVTAVPLRPIAKGSLTKLWVGVAALVLAAGGLAYAGSASVGALEFEVVQEGTGPSPTASDVVLVSYVGKLDDGKVFDENPQAAFPVDGVVPGFSQALQKMKKGGRYKVVIPPSLGYGAKAAGPIPANSTLHFDVHLLDFKSQEEIQRMQQQMQMMQGGAHPGGIPGQPGQ